MRSYRKDGLTGLWLYRIDRGPWVFGYYPTKRAACLAAKRGR